LLTVLVLVVVLAGACFWLLGTGSGLRFALARAQAATGGALSVGQARGRLVGPLTLRNVRYHPAGGADVRIDQAQAELAFWPLLRQRLHVLELTASGITVALPPPSATDDNGAGLSLQPPLDIVLDHVDIGSVRITRDGAPVFASDHLTLAGAWTADGIRVRQLQLRGPDGHVSLHGTLAAGGDYRGDGSAEFAWTVGDTTYAGTAQGDSDGRNATFKLALSQPTASALTLQLTQSGDYPWRADLEVPRFNPEPLLGPGSIRALAASLHGRGDHRGGRIEGQLAINDYTLKLAPLRAHFSDNFDALQLEQLTVTSPQVPGQLQASGLIHLDAAPTRAELDLRWSGVELPSALVGQTLATDGQLTAKGSTERFHAAGDLTVGPPDQPAHLSVDLDGTPQQIALHTLDLTQPEGGLQAHGTLTLKPALAWQLDATADDFDPGRLLAGWDGKLDADLSTRGERQPAGVDATLELRTLKGRLRQRQVRGHGTLHLSPAQVVDGTLELASGGSTVSLKAQPGATNDADVQLAIRSLADWLPDAGGRLEGHLHIGGKPPALSVNGTLQGSRLSWQQQKVEALHVIVGVPDISHPSGKLAIDARGVLAAGLAFSEIHALAEGSRPQHRVTLDANGSQLSAALAVDGSFKNDAWSGTLSTLTLDPQGLPRWRLQQDTALSYRDGTARLGELCLTAGDPLLCVQGSQSTGGGLEGAYRLRALPLALVMNAAGLSDLPLRVDGTIEGDGKLRRSAKGVLGGSATIRADQGSVSYTDRPAQPLLSYRDLRLQAELAPERQHLTVHGELDHGGLLDGEVTASGDSGSLDGNINLRLGTLAFVELFTSELANVEGAAQGNLRIGGTLDQPVVTGDATVTGFAAEVPSAGLALTGGKLSLATDDAQTFRVDGRVDSGKGSLAIGGTAGLGSAAATTLTVKGDAFTAVDIPAARVVMSPNLVIRQSDTGIDVTGRVALDSADVDVSRLPGAGATKASPDIVVVDEKQQQAAQQKLPISATVAVDLGKRTHVIGLGLDGNLRGQLVVTERPGRVTTAQGQVDVSGTYRAYGQNLTIEQGQLLYASTPVDNPRLDIRAVRKLNPNATVDEGQKVGLYISGTAQRPVLTVFSTPVMEQSDALSYLITGKPLSEVKGGEGSLVNSAAQALGSAGGDLLAKRIGAQLGVDDIGVSSNEALGGSSAFTVGKYLSPRLYLSYGVGLFEPGQVITLRYRLSKRWNFEAQNATDFSRASFNYRLER
jgi:translocation and assembly module TamB